MLSLFAVGASVACPFCASPAAAGAPIGGPVVYAMRLVSYARSSPPPSRETVQNCGTGSSSLGRAHARGDELQLCCSPAIQVVATRLQDSIRTQYA